MRKSVWAACCCASILLASTMASTMASAQEQPAQPKSDRGAVLLGGRVGGLVTFGGMNPNVRGGIELGYVFPWMNRSFAAALDVDYAAPKQESTEPGDPRLPGGSYDWHLTEQQLTIMPVFMYRFTKLGRLVPYGGIGPRIYLLRSNVKGSSGGQAIKETTEQSTKIGFGVPLGVEFALGPGALTGEVLLEYGPLDHTATGNSNVGAATLLLGYRFLL